MDKKIKNKTINKNIKNKKTTPQLFKKKNLQRDNVLFSPILHGNNYPQGHNYLPITSRTFFSQEKNCQMCPQY